jgi:hypothetical protein
MGHPDEIVIPQIPVSKAHIVKCEPHYVIGRVAPIAHVPFLTECNVSLPDTERSLCLTVLKSQKLIGL